MHGETRASEEEEGVDKREQPPMLDLSPEVEGEVYGQQLGKTNRYGFT